ncbi:hypothetical protein SteCoe_5137 [Stentor coeruleus]|uniref:Kinesin-like protein n=1 Tax=Stentor coeruleus TaxID=5963 RepID=A0A1R2CT42_9CILI|nr:hypothetical protein SteCoe_5137 [Stentor coeruleus]
MEDQNNVRVVCRFRPLNDLECQRAQGLCVSFSDQTVCVNSQSDSAENLKFTFDKVFTPESSQEAVYNFAAKPIVEGVMQGFNGTVFAYGQTSSGKTFTMSGPDLEDPITMGIIPRMVNTVFDFISDTDNNTEFTVKISFCEIYMEKIKDLLNPTEGNLKIHEDKIKGVFIEGLTEMYVSNDIEVHEIMKEGNENREVASTYMNAVSSRSHSLFIITVNQTNSKDFSGKVGKLFLVDLAGSEKVAKTGAAGLRLEEAKHINKSLTALGQVINSLTDGKSTHIPYRDSKLTRVLQDSLGGNSKTSLIVTCSPSPYNEAETISSLRFGIRAKAIKNKPKVNREHTVAELKLLLAKCQEEVEKRDRIIAKLENKLKSQGDSLLDISTCSRQSQEKIDADDIMAEIDELKYRLEEQIDISKKLKDNNDKLLRELAEIKSERSMMIQQLEETQQRTSYAEKSVKEQEVVIEKLVLTKDSLEKSIEIAMKNKISSDKIITEKDSEIFQLKQDLLMNSPQKQRKSITFAVSPAELQKVKSQNSELKKELELTKDQLKATVKEYNKVIDENEILRDKQSSSYRKTETFKTVSPEVVSLKEEIEDFKMMLNQLQSESEVQKLQINEKDIEMLKIKEENENLKKKISDIQGTIDEILTTKPPEPQIPETKIKSPELHKHEENFAEMLLAKEKSQYEEQRKRWDSERKDIMHDLENRINRVIELEITLDLAKEAHRNLEKNIGKNEKELIAKNQYMEKYISKLGSELQKEQLLKEKIKTECEYNEKKLKEQLDRVRVLEAECEEFKKKQLRLESRLKFAEEEAYNANNMRNRPSINHGNVRKPIKGGFNAERLTIMSPIAEVGN